MLCGVDRKVKIRKKFTERKVSRQLAVFVQQLLNGLKIGSVYALVALGYTMVYGIIKLINFAHGDFIMVGAYTLVFTIPLMVASGMPAWTAVIFAVVACVAVGVGVEKVAYKPVREKGNRMSALITAVAMSLFLENLAQVLFGASPKTVSNIFKISNITVGGVTLNGNTIITIIIGVVVMLVLQAFVQNTKMGRAMRAVSEDREASILAGIKVNQTITLTFAIGSGLAAIASLMYCAAYPQAMPTMGSMLGLKAFVAAVLGGIGIVPGAMIGGLVIGLVESLSKAYLTTLTGGVLTSAFSDAIVFGILIVVLLIKPAGILGKDVGEKV